MRNYVTPVERAQNQTLLFAGPRIQMSCGLNWFLPSVNNKRAICFSTYDSRGGRGVQIDGAYVVIIGEIGVI